MNITFRIWITALMIQPILFAIVFFEAAIFIIPFEVVGSLPGLLLFWIAVQILLSIRLHIIIKWSLFVVAAGGSAFLCNILFFLYFDKTFFEGKESILFITAAPLAAILALLVNANTINRHLISTEKYPIT